MKKQLCSYYIFPFLALSSVAFVVLSLGNIALADEVDQSGKGRTIIADPSPAGQQTPPVGTSPPPSGSGGPTIQTKPSGTTGQPPPAQIDASQVTPGEDARRLSIPGLLNRMRGVLDALIPFIIGLAVFVILWGIFLYITKAAEEEKRAEAKRFILWGVVGVFVMLSLGICESSAQHP